MFYSIVAKRPNDFSYGRAVAVLTICLSFLCYSLIFLLLAFIYKKSISNDLLLFICLGVMGAVAFIPGYGWVISSSYTFIAKPAMQMYFNPTPQDIQFMNLAPGQGFAPFSIGPGLFKNK